MASVGHKRAWEVPVAITLSIRGTAGTAGPGTDYFMRLGFYNRAGVAPTAPLADVGALPVPSETAKTGETDRRTWERPAVTTFVI